MASKHAGPKHEERIEIRMTAKDADSWRETASAEGMTLSDWIRQCCHARSGAPEIIALVRETKLLREKRLGKK
jgi:predicted DNA binding CopG/RHH family protein